MTKKAISLNSLQSRTLALFQELAKSPKTSSHVEGSDEIAIALMPEPHGNHVHIGRFVVSAKEASGFSNEKVWTALERKGLARSDFPFKIILTRKGQEFDTGLAQEFETSDH